MTTTLRDLVGLGHQPALLSDSALILIDCQNTYRTGEMKLEAVEPAIRETKKLLELAREHRIPIIHIQHDGGTGSPYDLNTDMGAIAKEVAPIDGEQVIIKQFPNAFVQTPLDDALRKAGVENLILAGFMTHMCIQSTAHGAFNLGYHNTVVASTTATRDLALSSNKHIPAQQVQEAALASIRDLYAVVVNDVDTLSV